MHILKHLSPASKGDLDTECEVDFGSATSTECMDYAVFLDELFSLRDMMAKEMNKKKRASLVDALKLIKVDHAKGAPAKSSVELTAALEAAKAATAEHGIQSAEARLAWETYEDIAGSGLENAMGVSLDEECQFEYGSEACKAIEELDRVMPILQSFSFE